MEPTHLVVLVGSLRIGSVNGAVARCIAAGETNAVTTSLFDLADVPLYNGDIEDAGMPNSVAALHDAVGACDGVVFCSPEYNGSFPAVTKNAIDWLSRPPRRFDSKGVTMISASPGGRAGLGVRTHFSEIMAHQPVRPFRTHGIGEYFDKLDETGELADAETVSELLSFVESFAEFCGTPVSK